MQNRKTRSKKGIVVCDIDGTLLNSPPGIASVIYTRDGETKYLTGEEFASWNEYQTHPERYDFSEFDDESRARRSIMDGEPIMPNIEFVRSLVVGMGYDMCVLSARHCEDAIRDSVGEWLENRFPDIACSYRPDLSFCVNTTGGKYLSETTSGRKCEKLAMIAEIYGDVVFIDDDENNIESASASLGNAVKCVKADKQCEPAINIVYNANR